MTTPIRVQLSRRRGWRMPPNTVKVDRTTKLGNPYKPGDTIGSHEGGEKIPLTKADCARLFRDAAITFGFLWDYEDYPTIEEIRRELVGKNLACWCGLDEPCHADVLLEIANKSQEHTIPLAD